MYFLAHAGYFKSQDLELAIYDNLLLARVPPFLLFWLFSSPSTVILYYIKSVKHIPYFGFPNLLGSLGYVSNNVPVFEICVHLCGTYLGEEHREVSFTAKDPNRVFWRFEKSPNLQ